MNYALVDVGNTSIKVKVFNQNLSEVSSFDLNKSEKSLNHFFNLEKIEKYLISSVVPELNEKVLKINPKKCCFLNHNDFSDLKINVSPIESVGIDRLVNAIAIKYKWDANVLVVDIGTAITFCKINKGGIYDGGIICPGFQMITSALNEKTAQLPQIQFPLIQPNIIGKSTKTAIESGLFHGSISMINGLINDCKKKNKTLSVVLTGGVPSCLLKYINHDVFEKDLQFIGLDILYKQKFL